VDVKGVQKVAIVGAGTMGPGLAQDLDVKRAVFAELDAYCPDDPLLTSTTSHLDVYRVVPERRLPSSVIEHWFALPQIVPLVEVVKGDRTSDGTIERVEQGNLGVRSGRGFYDYAGRDLEDVLAERDDALIGAFAAAGESTRQRVPRS
jgi:3-hydroxyacyl-CoA dehydrogenase